MKLTAPTRSDCERVRLWRNEVLETLRTPFPLTEEQQVGFYNKTICSKNSPHRYWSIIDSGQLVGFGGITNIEWPNRIGEISLIIAPEFRKQHLGDDAVFYLLYEAFYVLNLKTVFGEVYMCNSAVDFWKKSTGQYGATWCVLPNRKYANGKFWNSLYFSIDRDGLIPQERVVDENRKFRYVEKGNCGCRDRQLSSEQIRHGFGDGVCG